MYGLNRADVCSVFPGRPGCPSVGFSYLLNTTSLTAGMHTLTVIATDSDSIPDSGSWTVNITVHERGSAQRPEQDATGNLRGIL
jgi:hypothetical protein